MNLNVIMTQVALAIRSDGTYTPFSGDAWKYVGEMTLLGMGMIFSVLGILWAVLSIFKLVFTGKTPKESKKAAPAKTSDSGKTTANPTVAAPVANIPTVADDQSEAVLVAILTAAVAAYREEEGANGEFRVVSFKRSGAGRAWNAKK